MSNFPKLYPNKKGGFWFNAYVEGKQKRHTVPGPGKREALKQQIEMLASIRSYPVPTKPRHSTIQIVPEYIYFLQSKTGGPIKIGRSCQLRRRLSTLQISSSEELVLILTLKTTVGLTEKDVHKMFKNDHIRGEWFEASEDLVRWISDRLNQNAVKTEGSTVK